MATSKRVDLSEGKWCELPTWISHGQMKAIQRTVKDNRDTDMEVQTKLIALLVSEWNLTDEDGNALPITPAGIEKANQVEINEVFDAVTTLVSRASPNA